MSELDPQVFRDAADLILREQTSFCCMALFYTTKDRRYEEFLTSIFKPDGVYEHHPWWRLEDNSFRSHVERIEARILALLLCAEMCKSRKP